VIKAASVLGLPHICVEGKDNKMSLVATDVNNSSSDEFKSDLGETNEVFNFVFKIDLFFHSISYIQYILFIKSFANNL